MPITAATAMTTSPGHADTPSASPTPSQGRRSPDCPWISATARRRPAAAASRSLHPAPAFHTRRAAMSGEGYRQDGLRHPGRNVRADRRLCLPLGPHHLHPAPREDERYAGGHRGGDDVREPAPGCVRDQRAGGEGEQLPVARGDRGAEEPDPEREVLNDGAGSGDADAEQPAGGDLEEREHDHRQHGESGDPFSIDAIITTRAIRLEDLRDRHDLSLAQLEIARSAMNRSVTASAGIRRARESRDRRYPAAPSRRASSSPARPPGRAIRHRRPSSP